MNELSPKLQPKNKENKYLRGKKGEMRPNYSKKNEKQTSRRIKRRKGEKNIAKK